MTRRKFDLSLLPKFPDISYEEALWRQAIARVGGVDEAGRGALAGPVAAAVVILPADFTKVKDLLGQVNDSKKMSPKQRKIWSEHIKDVALAWAVAFSQAEEIDALGIVPATRLAVKRAMATLEITPQHLLVDYIKLPEIKIPQTALVKGDARVLSIACASVLAKTARDALMEQYDPLFPVYGFLRHKGYGTQYHRSAIAKHGPCSIHRRTFRLDGAQTSTD